MHMAGPAIFYQINLIACTTTNEAIKIFSSGYLQHVHLLNMRTDFIFLIKIISEMESNMLLFNTIVRLAELWSSFHLL